jgi:enoyl-[acyl-carrier protein] reductase II
VRFRSEFVDKWEQRRDDVRRNPEHVVAEMSAAMYEGRMHELIAGAGQSSGLVSDVLPAAEIVRTIVDEAERALRGAGKIIT